MTMGEIRVSAVPVGHVHAWAPAILLEPHAICRKMLRKHVSAWCRSRGWTLVGVVPTGLFVPEKFVPRKERI